MENSTQLKRGRPPINNQVIRVGDAIALPPLLRARGVDADRNALVFDASRGLLRGSAVSLEDVDNRLGYSDVTAFARAFRRWSGSSPAVWRRQHVAAI